MYIKNALDRGIANVKIEGMIFDDQMREWCQDLIDNRISYEEYLSLLKEKAYKMTHTKEEPHVL